MTKLTFIMSILLTVTVAYGQKPVKVLVKENEKSVFLVQCFNDKNEMVSTGSGFFIDKTGIAFTNVHVVKDAFKARIKTIDGKFYDVERLIDYNPSLDIAKIKIKNVNGTAFPAVKMATKKSEKGDDIFTIGNPDGLESSISTGIISSIRSIKDYGECYQITAPISPGSSGGALFNMNGEVIGITTFGQIDPNRLNQNLNFAVNIDNSRYLQKNQNLSLEKAYKDLVYEDLISACMRAQISGDYQKLFEISNNAIKKNSNNWVAFHFRGNANYFIEEYQNAESDLLKSIQLNKTDIFLAEDYNTLGIIYRRAKEYEKASKCYMKALELNKEFASCYCNVAVLLTEYYDPNKGPDNNLIEFFYTKSIEKDPTGCAFAYKSLATKAMQNNDIQLAIKFLTASIEIEKGADESLSINEYNNRGQAYIMLKNYSKAIEDFKYCTKLNPYDAESYAYIGYCYLQLNRKLDACASLNKAKDISEKVATDPKIKSLISGLIDDNCK